LLAGPSRTASTASRGTDRLQERLARAVAAKAAGQKADSTPRTSLSNHGSPRQSIDAPSRPSIESLDRQSSAASEPPKEAASPRNSQDVARGSQDVARAAPPREDTPSDRVEQVAEKVNGADKAPSRSLSISAQPGSESPMQPVVEQTAQPEPQPITSNVVADEETKGADSSQEDAMLQYQEEIHGYVERIDALESKLQYLAREASDAARKAALAAPAGGAEKKLAEKDQQIAQLMEEGKNLASTEQNLRAILKKLRAKNVENEKELEAMKSAKEKADKEIESLRRRGKRADELEKAQVDLQKRLDQTQREISTLRPEVRSKDGIIAELKAQLQKATDQADAMASKVNDQAREQDRRRIEELEESVAALQVEKSLVADRAKIQAADLKEKAERANERARALELELKAEVQVMEGKLEAMRVRAEEASSGAIGDSQVKLLRQVETLQTQYSIASENWQGIEATLLARIANIERERDEALQRESDMRKKAREAVSPPPTIHLPTPDTNLTRPSARDVTKKS
jgi:TATA element modulatory factor